jgi:PAS domain S-box-containing protein
MYYVFLRVVFPWVSQSLAAQTGHMRSAGWRYAKAILALITYCLPLLSATAAPVKEGRRVLIFYGIGLTSPAAVLVHQEIGAALQDSPYQIELYSEYLEPTLFSDLASQQELRQGYIRKYQHREPDVIIAVGPAPIKFMIDSHERFFPKIPIVFCASTPGQLENSKLDSQFTGAWRAIDPAKTLEAALRLQPRTEHVVVVGGVATYDRHLESFVKESFHVYESKFDFTYLTNLVMPVLLQKLQRLPKNTLIFYTAISEDPAGTHFIDETQSLPLVLGVANAPVFVMEDTFVGHGSVGGFVTPYAAEGRAAGRTAVRILKGEKPQDIPVVSDTNLYMFDWRAVRRWGFREADLPPGTVLLNKHPTVWDSYREYIIGFILLFFTQTLLIVALLWQRTRRRKTEAELILANDRLRRAAESAASVGWDWDVKTGRAFRFGDLRTMFGIPSNTCSGTIEDFYDYVHPEDRQQVSEAVTAARQNRTPYASEFRIIRPDGAMRWAVASGRFYYSKKNDAERMLGMAVDITDRKQAEEVQRRHDAIVEFSDDAIISEDLDGVIRSWNRGAQGLFGFSKEEATGKPIAIVIPEELQAEENENLARLRTGQPIEHYDTIHITKEKKKIDVSVTVSPIRNSAGKVVGASRIARNITERRRAEDSLRESEERFRLVANAAPVMIWMSGPDKLCTYFNQPWLEFTGRSIEAELGNGWADGVHPDDLQACLKSYAKAFDRQEFFKIEYRLRRHDGEYRWVLDTGAPRFSAYGSFAGYIGSCIDVSDRKLAEETLSTVSRRLIEAHEEERTRIARELHDDINQRIALFAVNLERLKQDLPAGVDTSGRIDEVREQVSELGSDVQSLSHRLHSSKLDYLGLGAAAAGFCRELSDRQKVQIDFHAVDVPKRLPPEISLCLFRVLQEALQNAVKHSGNRQFQVWLGGASHEIRLSVSDSGVGFNPDVAFQSRGLGLTSMKERLKLVGGEFSIDSQLDCGTTIHARVPLGLAAMSTYAGGSKH